MKNNYQNATRLAGNGHTTPKKAKLDAALGSAESAITLPDTVTVAIADLVGELEEGLLAFVVGTGLKVLHVILESEATAIAGPKGRHDPGRAAVRHGSDDGLVTLGGRRVSIRRPRLRSADRTAEVTLPTYELVASTELLGRETMARMLAKLSTRRYKVGLEPMGEVVLARTHSVSKSAVSRRFVAMTKSALAELMSADLSGLDLVAIMIDGANFADHPCVARPGHRHRWHQVALGRGGGRHRERNGGQAPPRRLEGAGPRCQKAHAVRDRRLQGPAPGDQGRLRPPSDRSL